MASSVSSAARATERQSLADVCGKPIKADLHPQVPASGLREVAAESIRRTGSQKAAAVDIGIHEARLSHKLQDGSLTLAQLESLGPTFAAELGKQLIERFGPLSDPKEHARRLIHDIEARLLELKQYVEVA